MIFEYIEIFYNTVYIHSHCEYLSLNQYEEQCLKNMEVNAAKIVSKTFLANVKSGYF